MDIMLLYRNVQEVAERFLENDSRELLRIQLYKITKAEGKMKKKTD